MTTPTATEPTTSTAPTTGIDTVLELPLTVAVRAAAAALTIVSRDDITPVLSHARFDGAHLYGTDRYRVVRYDLPAAPARPDDRLILGEPFLIHWTALQWVTRVKPDREKSKTKLATMSDAGYSIRFTHTELALAVELVDMFGNIEQFEAFPTGAGNFPPIHNILDRWKPAEAGEHRLDAKLLAGILTYVAKHTTDGTVTAEFGAAAREGSITSIRVIAENATFILAGLHRVGR